MLHALVENQYVNAFDEMGNEPFANEDYLSDNRLASGTTVGNGTHWFPESAWYGAAAQKESQRLKCKGRGKSD